MENEYPTEEQIKELFEAHLRGGAKEIALVLARRRAEEAARAKGESEPQDKSE